LKAAGVRNTDETVLTDLVELQSMFYHHFFARLFHRLEKYAKRGIHLILSTGAMPKSTANRRVLSVRKPLSVPPEKLNGTKTSQSNGLIAKDTMD
jgi:hypothetical protein